MVFITKRPGATRAERRLPLLRRAKPSAPWNSQLPKDFLRIGGALRTNFSTEA